jgi:hypothetical protein
MDASHLDGATLALRKAVAVLHDQTSRELGATITRAWDIEMIKVSPSAGCRGA